MESLDEFFARVLEVGAVEFWIFLSVLVVVAYIILKIVKKLRSKSPSQHESLENLKNDGSDVIVFLIHGTWATNASWTKGDSDLRQAISSSISPAKSTKFVEFDWSGRNTMNARQKATRRLKALLKESVKSNPDSKHIIISHSHGGNIAIRAISDEMEGQVDLVCMSTPFICARKGELDWPVKNAFLFSPLIVLILIGFYLGILNYGEDANSIKVFSYSNDSFVEAFNIAIVVSLLWIPLMGIASWRYSIKLYENLKYPRIASENVFIARMNGDEASSALAASELVSTQLIKLFSLPSSVSNYVRLTVKRNGFSALIILILSIVLLFIIEKYSIVGILRPDTIEMISSFGVYSVVAMVCFFLAYYATPILAAFIMSPYIFLVALAALPFGWEMVIVLFNLHITSETSPPGKWTINQLQPSNGGNVKSFLHSAIYEDPKALDEISRWVSSRV